MDLCPASAGRQIQIERCLDHQAEGRREDLGHRCDLSRSARVFLRIEKSA
jgi:hypothetical protein